MAKKPTEMGIGQRGSTSGMANDAPGKAKSTTPHVPLVDLAVVTEVLDRLVKRGLPRVRVVIHRAAAGGFWAEVPALRGCITEGETLPETVDNVLEAIGGWLEVAAESHPPEPDPDALTLELPL